MDSNSSQKTTECKHETVRRTGGGAGSTRGYVCVDCNKKFEELPPGSKMMNPQYLD